MHNRLSDVDRALSDCSPLSTQETGIEDDREAVENAVAAAMDEDSPRRLYYAVSRRQVWSGRSSRLAFSRVAWNGFL